MRILYVTNDLPWPLTSGYLRHYHLIRHLAGRHAITLLSLVKRGHDPDDAVALAPFTEAVLHVQGKLQPGMTVAYGAGKDPYCNLADAAGMGMLTFWGVPIAE